MKDNIEVNGYPIIMSLRLVTEPGEGWQCSRYIGSYETIDELNKAINDLDVPMYWQIKIDFEDKE